MVSDMEMGRLKHHPDDGNDNDDEYNPDDDDAIRALLTKTRGQRKEPVTRAVATLWSQIGGIVIGMCIARSSCPSMF